MLFKKNKIAKKQSGLLADDNDENHISCVFDDLPNNNALAYLLMA